MLTVLNPFNPHQPFPRADQALTEPDGLLAMGGCLSTPRLLNAYRHGIFPWFNEDEPILWWSPDPRLVLKPEQLKISRSLGKTMKKGHFRFSHDQDFAGVITACAAPREYVAGTWISAEMKKAYLNLHREGHAHSFESWQDDALVGGLYGVAIGRVFFGESMFHRVTDASKAAMVYACGCLVEWGYSLVDCQVHTQHLSSLGAFEMSRAEFIGRLTTETCKLVSAGAWMQTELTSRASTAHPWPG